MSVILEALNKARREKLPQGYDQHDLLGQITEPARRRRVLLRRIGVTVAILSVLGGMGLLGWYIMTGVPIDWLAARLQASSAAPRARDGAVAAADAAKAVQAGSTALANAAAMEGHARKAEVHFSDGTVVQFSGPALPPGEFAMPPARAMSVDELPPPVPLNALGPEADRSLPAAPGRANAASPYNVSAILWDERQSMAIVNGLTVLEGRKYGTFRVLQITPDKVVIQPDGGEPIALSQR
jgi:hypothetical protein